MPRNSERRYVVQILDGEWRDAGYSYRSERKAISCANEFGRMRISARVVLRTKWPAQLRIRHGTDIYISHFRHQREDGKAVYHNALAGELVVAEPGPEPVRACESV